MWDEIVREERSGREPTGLMKTRQTEYYDGNEKHLQFLEGLPEVSMSILFRPVFRLTAGHVYDV